MRKPTQHFAKFVIWNDHRVYTIQAEIRFSVRNDYVNLYTDTGYNPVTDHELYSEDELTEDNAKQILSDLQFIPVKEGFDPHNVEDLREIKSQLDPRWIEIWNMWADYTE